MSTKGNNPDSFDEKNNQKDEHFKEAANNDKLMIDFILSKSNDDSKQEKDANDDIDIIDAVKMTEERPKVPADTVKSVKQTAKEIEGKNIKTKTKSTKGNDFVVLGLKLMSITFVMALILAVVNQFTYEKIASQDKLKKNEAMQQIFEHSSFMKMDHLESYDIDKNVTEIFKVTKSGTSSGYCVNLKTNGFGGAIELIVGINESNKVEGVKVINSSETPNIGSKALDSSYLKNFYNLTDPVSFDATTNEGVSVISGATVTSTAVKDGINTAFKAVKAIEGGADFEKK